MAYIQVAALLLSASIGASGGWWIRGTMADAAEAKLEQKYSDAFAAWEKAARESSDIQRNIDRARREVVAKEAEDARNAATQDAARAAELDAVAARLRAANGRLLDNVARLAAVADSRGRDPTPATGSTPATGPGLVLAELYGSIDEEARDLAKAYDASRRAGLTCERTYDAVRTAPPS